MISLSVKCLVAQIVYRLVCGVLLDPPNLHTGTDVAPFRFRPQRKPTATLTASLLRPNPHDIKGAVAIQCPVCRYVTASSRARLKGSQSDVQTSDLSLLINGLSQTFCLGNAASTPLGCEVMRACKITSYLFIIIIKLLLFTQWFLQCYSSCWYAR